MSHSVTGVLYFKALHVVDAGFGHTNSGHVEKPVLADLRDGLEADRPIGLEITDCMQNFLPGFGPAKPGVHRDLAETDSWIRGALVRAHFHFIIPRRVTHSRWRTPPGIAQSAPP